MKKRITLSLGLLLLTTSAMATNGTNLIGYGSKSRAMGGTGVADFQGAESAFNNPALLGMSYNTIDITMGGTLLFNDVSYTDNTGGTTKTDSSTANAAVIPAVGLINKVNDKLSVGLSMYGTGGMGVDYREATNTQEAGLKPNDNLMNMRFTVPVSYNVIQGLYVGLAPVIEYSSLSMYTANPAILSGVSTDINVGYELGFAYTKYNTTVGVDYKSDIKHDFVNTFNSSTTGGVQSKLTTPSVLSVGISQDITFNASEIITINLDYKLIGNSDSDGFKDFKWDNQNVYAIGLEYSNKNIGYAVRGGYNYGESPTDRTSSLMMFPAVVSQHITIGGTYDVNKKLSVDASYAYATGDVDATDVTGGYKSSAQNDQQSLSVSLNYKFK